MRFARARMGDYEVIDFVVMLMGYASPRRTHLRGLLSTTASVCRILHGTFRENEAASCGHPFPLSCSPGSRSCGGAAHPLSRRDLVARSAFASPPGGVWDRQGQQWTVMDVDGTKQVARQRALPQTADLPAPHRRFGLVCAPGYLGRKRGEIARTRTTILQAHTHQWLGTFGNAGNGDYRGECATRKSFFWLSRRLHRHETSCFTRSILPRHAEVVTPRCGALGTM